MDNGLTQGGTSSPALFRMFINDLPKAVRSALHTHRKTNTDLDPTRLVADDVVGLVRDVESIQILLDACDEWAQTNKLRWNPSKSQIICTTAMASTMSTEVHLGGVPLKWEDEVQYLGLRLSKDGFLGKNPKDVERKCKTAIHMLVSEEWFALHIDPKHLVQQFISRVRSQMTYGAELLSFEARNPFIEADQRVTNLFLVKILNPGKQRPRHKKHQHRVQLALGLPTFEMDVDEIVKKQS